MLRNLAQMWRLMMLHTHQKCMKIFLTYIQLYGDSRKSSQELSQNGLREQEENDGLGVFIKVGGSKRGLMCSLNSCCHQRREDFKLSCKFFRCGADGEKGGMRLKDVSRKISTNELGLLILGNCRLLLS